jgi:hypothetical protein
MLELARPHTPTYVAPSAAHAAPAAAARDDLDEAHAAVWEAIRHLFPASAMVDQADYGCLLVSWTVRDPVRRTKHFAAPVIVRIEQGLLLALWTSDDDARREIASFLALDVAEALQDYDPHSRVPRCGVIVLGE